MPLFEYQCRSCGHRFEELSRAGKTPTCRACQSDDLEKLLSVFAVAVGGQSTGGFQAAPGPCGSCGDARGPGACSMN